MVASSACFQEERFNDLPGLTDAQTDETEKMQRKAGDAVQTLTTMDDKEELG